MRALYRLGLFKRSTALAIAFGLLALNLLVLTDSGAEAAATFVVNSTRDVGDNNAGDGSCYTGSNNSQSQPECTLRAAIEEANALAGTDTINFDIPTSESGYSASPERFTIAPGSLLPDISTPMIIDGTAQTEFASHSRPVIEVDGSGVSAGEENGLHITGGGTTIQSLAINRWGDDAIDIEFAGSNTIVGNYIGTDVTGTVARANAWGVNIKSGGNTVGGTDPADANVVSGNTNDGFYIYTSSATGNTIAGNFIGTNPTGAGAVPNSGSGIYLHSGANGNTIGGATSQHRNVISGNGTGEAGILIEDAASSGNTIRNNYIGTNASGTAAIPNNLHGIRVENAPNTQILDNLISGNDVHGVYVYNTGATGTQILRNTIGTNAAQTNPVPNQYDGIRLESWSSGTIIGSGGNGNVISGNAQHGVNINSSDDNTIQGNYIGTNAADADLGNAWSGVYADSFDSSDNLIGGDTAGQANVIAYNDEGVRLESGTNNTILANHIHSNTDLGIDLEDDGVTINDGGDGDSGANDLLNFPVITSAQESGGTVTVDFDLDVPDGSYRVEFFTNTAADASGYGEGETWVSSVDVAVTGGVPTPASHAFAGSAGDIITATATEGTGAPFGSTSEFSAAFTVLPGVASHSISGTVFEDIAGDVLNDGAIGDASNPGVVSADVRLYLDVDGDGTAEATDTFMTTVQTDANGDYSFSGLNNGKYFVIVDSKTVRSTAPAISSNDIWAEQTYGPAVSECADGAGGTVNDPTAGPCYGGRRAGISDNLTTWYSGAEHLAKIAIASADMNNIDFGFSFNVVTTTVGGNGQDDDPAANQRSVQGSLRQFITNANTVNGANTMLFVPAEPTNATDGGGHDWWSVPVSVQLPTVTGAGTSIDGTAVDLVDGSALRSPNSLGPELELNGNGTSATTDGLLITGGTSTVRDLVINRFGRDGIMVLTVGGNTIAGNYIGIDATGTTGSVGNGRDGIAINSSPSNTVGGLAASDRNILSGNTADGILVSGAGSTGNVIVGNYIGTNAAGSASVPNDDGIEVGGPGNTIGGTSAGARNVISGNSFQNMFITGSGNTVQGNYIGTNAAGTAGLGGMRGVWINTSSNNVVGGTTAAERNIISGNSLRGVVLGNSAANNAIHGNYIGTDATGSVAVPNSGAGVELQFSANTNEIGGDGAGEGNLIAHNNGAGILVSNAGTIDNAILGNSVFDNSTIGIDLNTDGVTPNDAGDGDTGPNDLLNFPVITSAEESGGTITVTFDLDVPANPDQYRVEFFTNPSGPNGGGNWEAETTASATTTGPGTGLTYAFPGSAGDVITATATRIDAGTASGFSSTSEVSSAYTVTGACADSDSDGLCDLEEDANTDADNDPTTNPGPDTDGDTLPDYLDADDDGDGTPTASENADPNGDGDPRDARDTDRDGQPDYLDLAATAVSDGTVADEQKISAMSGGLTPAPANGDEFGISVSGVGDLDGDGIDDIVVGADGEDDGGSNRGSVRILFMNADGTVKAGQKISDTQGGLTTALDNDDYFGVSVAGIGDIDGDGVGDIAVGADWDDDGGTNRGAVYILFLNSDGTVKDEQKISDTQGGLTTALDNSDRFGYSATAIGDLDDDGTNDLAVGAYEDDDGGTDRGAVYILFLNSDGTVKDEQKISDTQGGLSAPLSGGDSFGASVAGLGDLDGDGLEDIAVGARYDDDGGTDRGAVYILFLNSDGTVKDEQKISDTQGGLSTILSDDDGFGVSAAGLGDVDLDGVVDLAVGADGDSGSRGAVHVIFLNTDGTAKGAQEISSTTGGLAATLDANDLFGYATAGLGDLDGDGTIGLAVGAVFDDDGGTDRGAVYVLHLDAAITGAFVVNSTGDAGDNNVGDGSCLTGGTNSQGGAECTLRAAIEEANFSSNADTIEFDIPTTELGYSASPLSWTITPGASYDDIVETVSIDATTQPGFTGDPLIQLVGSSPGAAGATAAMTLEANNSLIEGFIVHSWLDEGLEIDASTGKGDSNTLRNNWVGIDAGGTLQSIGDVGILITVGANDNTIDGNVVGGAANSGIAIRNLGSDNNIVIGNSIGVGPDGSSPIPNGLHGIELYDQVAGNRIGGDGVGEPNLIANNVGAGIGIDPDSGADNAILKNSIHANGGLAIDNGVDGVTANDAGDGDSGANDLLNFPVITSASEAGGTITIGFNLDVPNGTYRVEFFDNTAADASGNGEGETFVSSVDVTVTAGVPTPASHAFAGSAGDIVTATATEGTSLPFGSTSEFSTAVSVTSGSFVVNSTGDAGDNNPGNGVCYTGANNSQSQPACTLRAAIQEANALGGPDVISFNMPASEPGHSGGVWTITPGSSLDPVSTTVTIDGTTQPGWATTPVVAVDGISAGGGVNGFNVTGDDVEIRSLAS